MLSVRLTKDFRPDRYARGLASWTWLDLSDKTPRFTSLFGDVFFEADDGWWFLDTIEGTLTHPWDGRIPMDFTLATRDGRDRYLLAPMAEAAASRGVIAGADEVYVFVPPPIVRGALDAGTVQTLDFVAALNIAGQIHRQIREIAAAG
jgi:hypothetical protein